MIKNKFNFQEFRKKLNKQGQEEMVGFALIVVIVAVIILVFLGFALRNSPEENVESYEVESFIQAFLQYTTDCAEVYEPNYLPVQELMKYCDEQEFCLDGRDACEVLNSTLSEIAAESWNTEEGSSVNGFDLNVLVEGANLVSYSEGNVTGNYKSSTEGFSKSGRSFEVVFTVYY